MRNRIIVLILSGTALLFACTPKNAVPVLYDTEDGSYAIGPDVNPAAIIINGVNVLKNAFVFNEGEAQLAISSQGDLDIISTIKRDSSGGTFKITLANTGKELEEINQLTILDMEIKGMLGVNVLGDQIMEIHHLDNSSSGLCLKALSSDLWQFRFTIREERINCSLDLSASAIVLLPDEELSLPALEYFYHLCAD